MLFDLWTRLVSGLLPDAGSEPLPSGPPKLVESDFGSEPAPPGPPR